MKKTQVQVFTVTQISQRLGITQSIIESALKREGIKPIMRVGNTRLFDEVAVEKINISASIKKSGGNNDH